MRIKILRIGQSLIERGAWFFAPISWILAFSVFCKNKLYDLGWIAPRRVDCTVVSVGNIVAGGTGKTPFIHKIAKTFSHRKVAILSRGYGKIPDEAWLLKRRLPSAKIYIGKNRAALAREAIKDGAELILLDDGFQHRKLHRDFDIVLLNLHDPFGKGHFLPQGYLRDHPNRLQKATAVFVNGLDFCHAPVQILDSQENQVSPKGLKAGLFCGIANPLSFKKTVEELGVEIVAEWFLFDHEIAPSGLLEAFAADSKSLGAMALITTEKDFIKQPRSLLPIVFVEIEIEWLSRKEQWENLIAKIDQNIDNRHTYEQSNKD